MFLIIQLIISIIAGIVATQQQLDDKHMRNTCVSVTFLSVI